MVKPVPGVMTVLNCLTELLMTLKIIVKANGEHTHILLVSNIQWMSEKLIWTKKKDKNIWIKYLYTHCIQRLVKDQRRVSKWSAHPEKIICAHVLHILDILICTFLWVCIVKSSCFWLHIRRLISCRKPFGTDHFHINFLQQNYFGLGSLSVPEKFRV